MKTKEIRSFHHKHYLLRRRLLLETGETLAKIRHL